jgi:hypothetical protein
MRGYTKKLVLKASPKVLGVQIGSDPLPGLESQVEEFLFLVMLLVYGSQVRIE